MTVAPKPKCDGLIWSGFRESFCGRTAKYEHDGRHFCKTHHPPTVQEKRVAADEKNFKLYKERQDHIAAYQAAAEKVARNAARYLWLRDRIPGSAYRAMGLIHADSCEGIDVAIDAAMNDPLTATEGER